ncbi:hypothetical protein LV84_02247 [Algoriphagus ratkowskyi]|uniref:Uncharacterized protein n=1 Tax=Algoriphagus ratkowskyi TaxID=57028 RepID=A0A2W7RYA9_9BACT|nr:hypothetical protein LV84_02247 [Algoriphagus ratkowskyi]
MLGGVLTCLVVQEFSPSNSRPEKSDSANAEVNLCIFIDVGGDDQSKPIIYRLTFQDPYFERTSSCFCFSKGKANFHKVVRGYVMKDI